MAISLEKGQRIEIGLSKVSVGLGWDPNEGTGFDFDLDASAFMLGANKNFLRTSTLYFTTTKSLLMERLNLLVTILLVVIAMVAMMKL